MLSKAIISQIRLLHHKKHRDEQGLFIVEGLKSCKEVLQSDFEVTTCYITERHSALDAESPTFNDGSPHTSYLTPHTTYRIPHTTYRIPHTAYRISVSEMARISCLTTAPEILCIVKKPNYTLNELDDEKPLLVLDAIRDPGNLGTIIRTADWFGFEQIICSEDCVEFTNPKVIQATMGSFTRVKIVYTNLQEYLKTQTHRTVYGLYMNGEQIQKQSFHHNDIVIIGSESHGISETLLPLINKKIEIPMYPHKNATPESLNAAMAAGVFMFEFRRCDD